MSMANSLYFLVRYGQTLVRSKEKKFHGTLFHGHCHKPYSEKLGNVKWYGVTCVVRPRPNHDTSVVGSAVRVPVTGLAFLPSLASHLLSCWHIHFSV